MRKIVCFSVLLLALAPAALEAEPLVIRGSTGSVFVFDFEGDFFRFAGNGFEIATTSIGVFVPRVGQNICDFCRPGDPIDASFHTPGDVLLGSGFARFGRTPFSDVTLRGALDFRVTPVAFPADGRVSAPFSFTGNVRGFSGEREAFAVDLVGRGHTLQPFFENEGGTFATDEGRINFDFESSAAATPEPATMLLLGSGMAAAIFRSRRKNDPSSRDGGSARTSLT